MNKIVKQVKEINKKNTILPIQLFEFPDSNNELFDVISSDAILVRRDYIENDRDFKSISLTNGIKIFSLRSIKYGGKFNGSIEKRHALLLEAMQDYDVIELEAETDLTKYILNIIPPSKRIISWHGKVNSYDDLEAIYRNITSVPAEYYQLVTIPKNISECIWPLQLLHNNSNKNLTAYASGAVGVWTQVLSAFMGSSMICGNINKKYEADLFLTLEQLKEDYGLPYARKIDTIFGIAGNPVFASMSPNIHNKCYEYLEMNALYLPFHVESFDEFWMFISKDFKASGLGFELGGFTMVSPLKEESFQVAEEHLCNPTILSKACNILVSKDGRWYSDSSDGLGVISALDEQHIDLRNKEIAIIGCGGAGRTIASRIKSKGANIVFYNRSTKRGQLAATLLDLPYRAISEFDASEFDIVINATPVGKNGKMLIFDPSGLKNNSITIDMAYAKKDTRLVMGCRKHNKNIIEGKQILLHQVKKQFTCLTGRIMPFEVELMVREKTENKLRID